MKRSGYGHWKLKVLASKLRIPAAHSVGIVETMWHVTARMAPQGDIGKLPETFLAAECGWPLKKSAELIRALVEAKLLDEVPPNGLLVHDWSQHCDDSVSKWLVRNGLKYADGTEPRKRNDQKPPVLSGHGPETTGQHPTGVGQKLPALALALASALASPSPDAGEGEWIIWFRDALKATGKFPNLNEAGVAQVAQAWPRWRRHAADVIVEAQNMSDRTIGSPIPWLQAAFGKRDLPANHSGTENKNDGPIDQDDLKRRQGPPAGEM